MQQAYFPGSVLYQSLFESLLTHLRERPTVRRAFPYSERHLHCVWQDPSIRPHPLTTRDGERVEVESAGIWNREAGPDFLGAVLRLGEERRRLAGDVEIHVHPGDWSAHGHEQDPRYQNVRFHVTYFQGAKRDVISRPGTVHVILQEALEKQAHFHFDHIDTTAYPYSARADRPPCSLVLACCAPTQRETILSAAGEERLRRKAMRLRALMETIGPAQALYEEVMVALGYKHNKAGFRFLARAWPVEEWTDLTQGDAMTAYAILMGLAGLIPATPTSSTKGAKHQWIRRLWDHWWRVRHRFAQVGSPPPWRLDGLRPANHPARRLMAAAHLFTNDPYWGDTICKAVDPDNNKWVQQQVAYLTRFRDDQVGQHLGLRAGTTSALIGRSRAVSILVNVLLPYLAARDASPALVRHALEALPVEPLNALIKQTAFHLFGRDHAPSLYQSTLARQGLLQIFHDFCLNDRSRCAACSFPAALEAYRSGQG